MIQIQASNPINRQMEAFNHAPTNGVTVSADGDVTIGFSFPSSEFGWFEFFYGCSQSLQVTEMTIDIGRFSKLFCWSGEAR
jgi:hypothetical protein